MTVQVRGNVDITAASATLGVGLCADYDAESDVTTVWAADAGLDDAELLAAVQR